METLFAAAAVIVVAKMWAWIVFDESGEISHIIISTLLRVCEYPHKHIHSQSCIHVHDHSSN